MAIYPINRDSTGLPISGQCSKCGKWFQFIDADGGRKVEAAYASHECKPEDFSQAAARIVREATKD